MPPDTCCATEQSTGCRPSIEFLPSRRRHPPNLSRATGRLRRRDATPGHRREHSGEVNARARSKHGALPRDARRSRSSNAPWMPSPASTRSPSSDILAIRLHSRSPYLAMLSSSQATFVVAPMPGGPTSLAEIRALKNVVLLLEPVRSSVASTAICLSQSGCNLSAYDRSNLLARSDTADSGGEAASSASGGRITVAARAARAARLERSRRKTPCSRTIATQSGPRRPTRGFPMMQCRRNRFQKTRRKYEVAAK